jgi:hypothetical protein
MDKLAKELREDAQRIEAKVSPQLEERIRASLASAAQERAPAAPVRHAASFWWASSLTGIAATLLVIVVFNLSLDEPEPAITEPAATPHVAAQFDWNLKPAMLTETLEQELVDIQSDLKKAERVVREDIEQIGVNPAKERDQGSF